MSRKLTLSYIKRDHEPNLHLSQNPQSHWCARLEACLSETWAPFRTHIMPTSRSRLQGKCNARASVSRAARRCCRDEPLPGGHCNCRRPRPPFARDCCCRWGNGCCATGNKGCWARRRTSAGNCRNSGRSFAPRARGSRWRSSRSRGSAGTRSPGTSGSRLPTWGCSAGPAGPPDPASSCPALLRTETLILGCFSVHDSSKLSSSLGKMCSIF